MLADLLASSPSKKCEISSRGWVLITRMQSVANSIMLVARIAILRLRPSARWLVYRRARVAMNSLKKWRLSPSFAGAASAGC